MGRPRTKAVVQQETPHRVEDIYSVREPSVSTFSSGCTLLDKALGGGWAYNRLANIVGDKSTGKSLLAIEACANFASSNKDGRIVYAESEAAFDEVYAEAMGLPINKVEFVSVFTVEYVFEDIEKRLKSSSKEKVLYVIDSLDALSDRAEQERTMDQGTYGTKSKMVSEWLRRQNQRLAKSHMTLIITSQVRDNIGVAFGEKHKRSGGRALDFYATHTLWLAKLGSLKATRSKVERVIGVEIRAAVKKNKIGLPFREVEFPILFGYGIEDVWASLAWLDSVERVEDLGMDEEAIKVFSLKRLSQMPEEEYVKLKQVCSQTVIKFWDEIEHGFAPVRKKYA